MTVMDVFGAACVLIVGWTGYELGRGREREDARRRAAAQAERAAARKATMARAVAREAAASHKVVDLAGHRRSGRAS